MQTEIAVYYPYSRPFLIHGSTIISMVELILTILHNLVCMSSVFYRSHHVLPIIIIIMGRLIIIKSQLIFSIQNFRHGLLPCTANNPKTEVERRVYYIKLLEGHIGVLHPNLVLLVKDCLHDKASERPSTEVLLTKLQRMKVEVEGAYGIQIRLDLEKLRQAKEMKIMLEQQVQFAIHIIFEVPSLHHSLLRKCMMG